jgi:hypothetical protein
MCFENLKNWVQYYLCVDLLFDARCLEIFQNHAKITNRGRHNAANNGESQYGIVL